MKLTVKAKLLAGKDDKRILLETMERFNAACNYISKAAFEKKIFGQVGLHRLSYKDVRARFNLSSQFAVRAIGKVRESYKGRGHRESLHVFKEHSAVVYDQRILSFKNLSIVSILTLDGRRKIAIKFGSYAQLEQRVIRGQADLIYSKGDFFLCLTVEHAEASTIEPTGYLGLILA
jgi:putative transposase